jgi:hypothetical protein
MSLFKNVNVVYVYVQDWEAAKKFYTARSTTRKATACRWHPTRAEEGCHG